MAVQIFTPADIAMALESCGGIKTQAARKLGCTRSTIDNYIKRYPELQEVVNQCVREAVDAARAGLYYHVKHRNLAACIFLLKTLGRDEGFSLRDQFDRDGGSIQVVTGVTYTIVHEHGLANVNGNGHAVPIAALTNGTDNGHRPEPSGDTGTPEEPAGD